MSDSFQNVPKTHTFGPIWVDSHTRGYPHVRGQKLGNFLSTVFFFFSSFSLEIFCYFWYSIRLYDWRIWNMWKLIIDFNNSACAACEWRWRSKHESYEWWSLVIWAPLGVHMILHILHCGGVIMALKVKRYGMREEDAFNDTSLFIKVSPWIFVNTLV